MTITRKRAMELAQEAISERMNKFYSFAPLVGTDTTWLDKENSNSEYAELAAALAYFENLARQKEMHL